MNIGNFMEENIMKEPGCFGFVSEDPETVGVESLSLEEKVIYLERRVEQMDADIAMVNRLLKQLGDSVERVLT